MSFGANRKRESSNTFQNLTADKSSNVSGTSDTEFANNSTLSALQQAQRATQQQQTGQTNATFDPRGNAIIAGLTDSMAGGGNYIKDAAAGYGGFTGAVSPYTENIISGNNAEANKNFASRLAQVRAGAYRGGTAANIGKQGQLAADFTSQQAADNAKLRDNAYQQAQTMKLGATSGLASLGNQQQNSAAQLLALLRGTSTAGTATGTETGTTSSTQQGTQSGTSSTKTAQQIVDQLRQAMQGGGSGTSSGTSGQADFGGILSALASILG